MVRQDIIHNETIARLPKAERWEFLSLAAGMRKSGSEDYRLRAPVEVFKGLLGRSRRDLLVKTLTSWQEVSLISFIDDGEVFEISVCNPSDLFKMTTPKRPNSVVTETETETETKTERNSDARVAKKSPPARAPRVSSSSKKITKPERFEDSERDQILAWANGKGFGPHVIQAGMELFQEWEPLKNPSRTREGWVASFKRITRESVAEGTISTKPPNQTGSTTYGHVSSPAQIVANELVAEARRAKEQAENEPAAESEDPEAVAEAIRISFESASGRPDQTEERRDRV